MKNTLIAVTFICFLLAPPTAAVDTPPDGQEAPPINQVLVREGDFALQLAQVFELGGPAGEAEAMSALAAAGIAPRNGWIADYPVTPDILTELEAAVGAAADEGRLAAGRDQSLRDFQDLAAGFGLTVAADPEAVYAETEPPADYPRYTDPTIIERHYYNAGPPVVTYYPPPRNYYYLYSWVPYPFYWHSYWFPGFFILHDFNRVVFVKHRTVRVVSNHVFSPRFRKVVVVDHRSRTRGKIFEDRRSVRERRGFESPEAQRGAASIVQRSRERGGSRGSAGVVQNRGTPTGRTGAVRTENRRGRESFTNRGPDTSNSRGSRSGSFSRPSTTLRPTENRSGGISDNRGARIFNPSAPSSPGRSTRFEGSSGQRRAFDAARGNNQGRSSIQRNSSGRTGTAFERPSRSGDSRSQFRRGSGSGREGFRQEMRGRGGDNSRGSSARSGSSGGRCIGRC